MRRRVVAAVALGALLLGAAPPLTASVDALDFIELQIVYTTIVARYYKTVDPSALVDGARTGIAASLVAQGIETGDLAYTPPHLRVGDGEDRIDALVVGQLARYGKRLDGHRLVAAAVAGELAALHDPYTLLFRPPAFRSFNAFLGNARFGGIGAIVSFDAASQTATLDRILPGSPAEAAGLVAGDVLLAVNGRSLHEIGGAGVRDALRGKIGTPVALTYRRPGATGAAGSELHVTIVRGAIRDPEVQSARFGDTGYVALSRFGDRAGTELAAAIRGLAAAGIRSLVLDLRANGGGYADEATAVASDFVRSGPIFTTYERGGSATVAQATGKVVWSGSLAVLVDGDTASAAEIVAGAVQDTGAGTLVGVRTFGKGVVQSVFPLPDGSAVKLTTARYATAKGRDIDRTGITPDIVVVQPPGSANGNPATDPQLARALAAARARLPAP